MNIEDVTKDLLMNLTLPVDQIIIDAEKSSGRFPEGMLFDYYFNPISHICALKWSSEVGEADEVDPVDEGAENSHSAKDVRL